MQNRSDVSGKVELRLKVDGATVAGGLAVSTFFTLWVVPLAYTVFDDLASAFTRRLRWALRPVGLRRAPRGVAAPDAG